MASPAALRTGSRAEPGISISSQALLVVDDECICREVSLGASRLLGAGRSAIVGRQVADLLEPDSRESFRLFWLAFGDTGGHAGPFALDAPAASVEVQIGVEAEVLPGRHILVLGPPGHAVGGAPSDPLARSPVHVGGDPQPRDPTGREREILGLLAGGATDVQIAEKLSLSPATVQTHVRNAKSKLGARTRAQAVALALRRGLIHAA